MIIDFHTHIFPDYLAKRAIETLFSKTNGLFTPVHDGTLAGLLRNMDDWGIDVSVVQPVITKQAQTKTVNQWAQSICSNRIIGFGGVFPHTDDYKRDIDYVAGLGLKGIKFHAEYQDFFVDDPYMLKIYDYALSKGLILLHHGGFDIGFKGPFKSSPQRFLNVAKAMKGGVIVAAHLGGGMQWDDVFEHLAGSDIYLDTSMGFKYYSQEIFLKIVKKHGAKKILFGSDAPWSMGQEEIEHLKAMPLSESEINDILSGNAKRILII